MSTICARWSTFEGVIPPNPDYLAIIRLTLERWLEMTAEQRAVFTDVVTMLAHPSIIVNPLMEDALAAGTRE